MLGVTVRCCLSFVFVFSRTFSQIGAYHLTRDWVLSLPLFALRFVFEKCIELRYLCCTTIRNRSGYDISLLGSSSGKSQTT